MGRKKKPETIDKEYFNQMTEDAINFIEAGINSLKYNLGETWEGLITGAKEGYNSKRVAKNEKLILNFETFVKECYRY